jgi:putative ABC transport system ATP-binding protein
VDAPVIATTGLRKVYDSGAFSVEALRGIDLTVWEHEFVSIMGPSGSGKSTLLSIVGLLERPTAGTYKLVGEDVADFDDRRAARVRCERIGFVFQAFNLLPRSTALQNVELPLVYGRVGRDERRQRAQEALAAVGLADRAEHLPSELSGGQQQRAALARAIVTRPAVVIADEPTGNLDSHSEDDVLSIFEELHAGGATIVMVTHSREVAERGTRIVHMLDGLLDRDEALGAAAVEPAPG